MTVRPAYGLDRCDVWRPDGAPGIELVSAPVAMRAFTPRLSFTLGICLKVGSRTWRSATAAGSRSSTTR